MTSVSWPRAESDTGGCSRPAKESAFPEEERETGEGSDGLSPVRHKESCEETKGPARPHEAFSRGSVT